MSGREQLSAADVAALVDPFRTEREKLLSDKDPCVRVCGRIADCYGLTAAQLLERVEPDEWEVWLASVKHQEILKRADRLQLGTLEAEMRAIGLGLSTRRGQPIMLKTVVKEARARLAGRNGDDKPSANPLHRLSQSEVRRLAGEDDEEDEG